jgi:hypothetical protein
VSEINYQVSEVKVKVDMKWKYMED